MVAWLGGDGFMAGGGLAVGWVPLGPGELLIPCFHASARYFDRVNMRNTTISRVQITKVYTNVYVNGNASNVRYMHEGQVHGAVTVVPRTVLTAGRPVSGAVIRVSPGTLAFRQVEHTAPVAPQREAVLERPVDRFFQATFRRDESPIGYEGDPTFRPRLLFHAT